MDMTGEYRIPADKQRVWEALNDPEVLQASIPNCESIEKTSDTEMRAAVNAKVGPLKAKFDGKVTLSNMNPPTSYTLTGEGQGAGGVGFAKGSVDIKLTEDGDATVLAYTVSAQVGGKLAQIGSRLIDSVAQQQAKQFFTAFVDHFDTPAEPAAEAAPATASEPAPAQSEPTPTNATPTTSEPARAAAALTPEPDEPKPAPTPATSAAKPKSDAGYLVGPIVLFVIMLVLLYFHQSGW